MWTVLIRDQTARSTLSTKASSVVISEERVIDLFKPLPPNTTF